MTQRISITMFVGAVAGLALAACGSPAHPSSTASPSVSGVASTGASAATVTLKDSSTPTKVATATAAADGSFSIDVSGLTAPYLLRAQWQGTSGTEQLYSMATQAGRANINTLTDVLVAATSATGSGDDVYTSFSGTGSHMEEDAYVSVLNKLSTVLAPLYSLYGVTSPITDDAMEESSGLIALLKDVSITIVKGTVVITNRATGGVIYSAPLSNITSGTFNAGNMPAGPGTGATCTSFTYSAWGACQPDGTQTRTVLTSSPTGCTGGSPVLTQACTYVPPSTTCTSFTYSAWGACQPDNTQTRTVLTSSPTGCTGGSPVLTQACTYVPPACTYTYSAWSACSASGTQTRTVLTSTPTGCTGTPVLSQSCTPSNPVTSAMVVSSCTMCHGLTSNTTVFKSGGYTVVGRTASQWLTTVNNMVALGATLAPGTTAQNYADYLANVP